MAEKEPFEASTECLKHPVRTIVRASIESRFGAEDRKSDLFVHYFSGLKGWAFDRQRWDRTLP